MMGRTDKPVTRRVLETIHTLQCAVIPDLVKTLELPYDKVKHAVHTLAKFECVQAAGMQGFYTVYAVAPLGYVRLEKPWKPRKVTVDDPIVRDWSVSEVIARVPNSVFNMGGAR